MAKQTTSERARLYDGDTFEVRGYTFRVRYEQDEDLGPPWKEHDGHGVIHERKRAHDYEQAGKPSKAPDERILWYDRWMVLVYDIGATLKLAKKDGWGCPHSTYVERIDGTRVLWSGHTTAGKALACAVESDFAYCRGYANDEWSWVYVVVTLLDEDGNPTNERESLGGIDGDHDPKSHQPHYLTDVAYELADDILSRVEVDTPDAVSEN